MKLVKKIGSQENLVLSKKITLINIIILLDIFRKSVSRENIMYLKCDFAAR